MDRILLAALFFICAGLVARFLTSYLAAMMDGEGVLDAWLLVMPYSQLWLALLAGWLIGLQPQAAPSGAIAFAPRRTFFAWLAILISAVALLSFVVVRDYPNLGQREEMYAKTFSGHLQPRFWAQGVIAIDTDEYIKNPIEASTDTGGK